MRWSVRWGFGSSVLLLAGLLPAAEPAPLVKAATVPAGSTRVRFELESDKNAAYRLKAIIPPPKLAKAGAEPVPATIALDTALGDIGYVTRKKLKALGYDAVAGQTVVLPEVLLIGEAVGLKPKPGEVRAKANNVKLLVLEKAYGSEEFVGGADIQVNIDALLQGVPSLAQPWVYFGLTPLFEANYPERFLVRMPTEVGIPPAKAYEPEEIQAGRVPMMVAMKAGYVLPYAGFHGKPAMSGPRVVFALGQVNQPGVFVTHKMAQMYDLKPDPDAKDIEIFADFDKKGKAVIGKINDLRIPVNIDAGFKTARELTTKETPLILDQEQQMPALYIGPGYFTQFLQEPTFAVGSDGTARLYGYVDPKNVPVAPKKKP